ncbi:MAG: RidA family protein [Sphingomonadales bacterium]|jgi:enamine deaminase RidA (YjgF/YER057c/UK114 family)
MSVEARLKDLGLTLPKAAAPAANYVPFVVDGGIVHISGQLPMGPEGLAYQGKVGAEISEEDAVKAAQLCALNIIAQLREACGGDLGRVRRIVRLGGFVNCVDGFGQQPAVINGASDLMVAAFGDIGRHARAAVGTNALPFNAPVEIDAIASIE